jgi:diguanylate cyclase (GGDEF)-like protein
MSRGRRATRESGKGRDQLESASRIRAVPRKRDTPLRPGAPLPSSASRALLTVMSGLDAGRIFPLDQRETVIGRDPEAHLWVSDPAVSWRHARLVRGESDTVALHDLGSRNGTFVEGTRVEGTGQLEPGARLQLGPSFLLRFTVGDAHEESFQRVLYESSVRDALTGLFNRRYFDQRLASELSHAHRSDGALAVLLIDVDHFKELNDTHGHRAGDEVLCELARQLGRVVRAEDVFARWGGDEFIVLARDATTEAAEQLAERLRAAARSVWVMADGSPLSPSVSVGVVTLPEIEPNDGPPEIVARADDRLYCAKLAGRDCVRTRG